MSVFEDVNLAKKIIFDEKRTVFQRIYSRTNEDLNEILLKFDFEDKDVLSVLASSDQLFSLYYLGVKSLI